MNTNLTGQWQVNIRRYNDDEIIRAIPCGSERQAEKVERGVEINLNHAEFYTEVVFCESMKLWVGEEDPLCIVIPGGGEAYYYLKKIRRQKPASSQPHEEANPRQKLTESERKEAFALLIAGVLPSLDNIRSKLERLEQKGYSCFVEWQTQSTQENRQHPALKRRGFQPSQELLRDA